VKPIAHIVATHWRLRRVLVASARVELQKRYAGSLLGPLWTVLYPLLFLSVYLFLWLVVFRVRFDASTTALDYVVFVFGGLVPYLFVVETVNTAVVSIRQNIHLVKGVIVPVELIPTRAVLVALAAHGVGLALVLALSVLNRSVSWHVVWLPAVLVLQLAGLVGIAWILAALGVLVPDVAYLVNIGTMLLMFVSPIAFRPEMVPEALRPVVWLNPVRYMIDAYRATLVGAPVSALSIALFAAVAIASFAAGASFCWRFKNFIVDFE
jgi:lipopolysaccharide transport system permease protein